MMLKFSEYLAETMGKRLNQQITKPQAEFNKLLGQMAGLQETFQKVNQML